MVHDLAVGGRKLGVESVAMAHLEDGLFRAQLEASGVPTRFFDTDPGYSPSFVLRLAVALKSLRADVLHAHHFSPLLHGIPAAAMLGIPVVYTEHSREFYDTPRRRALGRAAGRAATVVCVSEELAQWRAANFDERDVRVVLNGVRVPPPRSPASRAAARERIGLGSRTFAVGCVARMVPDKGHEALLRAVRTLIERGRDVTAVLVGSGPFEAGVRNAARDLGLDERCLFLGNRTDVDALLDAFDVIALASVREGLPVSLLEGMAHALPVVATDVGDIGSLTAGGCGQVVDIGEDLALADALDRYARSPRLCADDGARARAKVVASYSADAMVARYVGIYRALTR